jgi:hypothetical protein
MLIPASSPNTLLFMATPPHLAADDSKQDRIEMSGSDSFMFASLAEELGLRDA